MGRIFITISMFVALTFMGGCGEQIDCEALCARMLACEVTFDAPDDVEGDLVESGARTQSEACVLGCEEIATPEVAGCVDELDIVPDTCQDEVIKCAEPILL